MDLLASEYGWSKHYIWTKCFPEDVIILQDKIMLRQTEEVITNLRIATNPHLKPDEQKEFAEQLMARRRQITGVQDDQLDRSALNRLKEQLKKESKAVKVK